MGISSTQDLENGLIQNQDDELQPLLSSPLQPTSHKSRAARNSNIFSALQDPSTSIFTWHYVVALCGLIIITTDIGAFLTQAPQIRLYESIICADYYKNQGRDREHKDPAVQFESAFPVDVAQSTLTELQLVLLSDVGDGARVSIPEVLCKVDAIQDELALVLGWQVLFDNLPGIILAIPYGLAADMYGRRGILMLNLVGMVLAMAWIMSTTGIFHFPIRYTWFSSAFLLLGGGGQVLGALLFTIIADVVPIEQRSSIFFYISSIGLVSELLGPPTASYLMERNLWSPLMAGFVAQTLGVLVAIILPETLVVTLEKSADVPQADNSTGGESILNKQKLSSNSRKLVQRVGDAFEFLNRDTAVALLVFGFLVLRLGKQAITLLLQYASKRYGWTIAQANLLFSLRATVNLALLLVLLPAVTSCMLRRTDALTTDLWVSRGSIAFMVLGSLLLGLAATPSLMILGLIVDTLSIGYAPAVRSLLTSMVDTHDSSEASDIARLYSFIAIMYSIGSLLSGPGMSLVYHLSLTIGGIWTGLPYLVAAALFTLAGIPVFVVKIPVETSPS